MSEERVSKYVATEGEDRGRIINKNVAYKGAKEQDQQMSEGQDPVAANRIAEEKIKEQIVAEEEKDLIIPQLESVIDGGYHHHIGKSRYGTYQMNPELYKGAQETGEAYDALQVKLDQEKLDELRKKMS